MNASLNGTPFVLYDITLPDILPTLWSIMSLGDLEFLLGVPEPVFPNTNAF